MKTWENVLLYPIGFYLWLESQVKKLGRFAKPAIAMLVMVAMLFSMVPFAAFAVETTETKWAFGTAETAPDDSAYTNSGTLAEAFTAANGNEDANNTITYVKLNKNVEIDHASRDTMLTLSSGKAMVLDLNENTFTSKSSVGGVTVYGIKTAGNSSLSVKNGTISVSSSQDYAVGIESKGDLNIANCTVAANGMYVTDGIYYRGAAATVTNCTITVTSASGNAMGIEIGTTTPDLTIADCTINANGGTTAYAFYANEYWGKMEFTVDGTVTATGSTGAFNCMPTTKVGTVTAGNDAASAEKVAAPTADTYANKYVKIQRRHTATASAARTMPISVTKNRQN